ncbi:hypothetical protein BDN72DRAFT_407117 [Pluteus cervinus]|uniref:Uncharacterized protein n=1 Tax=Pluteus cervinus TaxID=181527 RepID=A0ACD3A8M5_9AGAR|nr:hypothetical protein BDN72DRAFT_407117 [Pluteus cervinus]
MSVTVAGAALLALEPTYLLTISLIITSSIALFILRYTYRIAGISQTRLRCFWRQCIGERGLMLLPDELLAEVVSKLEWRDILAIRQTCKRLCSASKALHVWRNVVGQEPSDLLFLECPIQVYTAERLEFLFLRRKKAEGGYHKITQGAKPHRYSIPMDCVDLQEAAVHLVRGGRWLLIATRRGSLVYYDLDAQNHVAHILVPERGSNYSVALAVDMQDPPSLSLSFKVALARQCTDASGGVVEVWQVDLVLGNIKQGVGLRAENLACFGQEIDGHFEMLSLLGEQLALTIFHHPHRTRYTILISWRAVRGPNYAKRVHMPEYDLCSVRFLHPDVLISVLDGLLTLTSRLSLPEVTHLPDRRRQLPYSIPFLAIPFDNARPETLSTRMVFQDSIRFLVSAGRAVYGIIVRDPGDGHYGVEITKLSELPDIPHPTIISHSADYFVVWPTWLPLVLQQLCWDTGKGVHFPAAHIDACSINEPAFQLLDITSGRILVEDEQGMALFDFSS